MAIELISKIKPKNGGEFALVDAVYVEMPDGTRLSELNAAPKIVEGTTELQPDIYHVFGAVSDLSVTLVETNDGKAHEYWFEFEPTEDFAGLTISPAVQWMAEPQYPAGKKCIVGIVRGMAVMGCG